jgi:heme-degrading monooxygenase HmoA
MKKTIVLLLIILTVTLVINAQTTYKMIIKSVYIEIAKFKLKTGFTDEQFIEAELAVRNGMIKSQKGFISREISKDTEDNWMIDMRFETKADMEAWFVALKQDPTMKTYGSMVDFQSMRSEFFDKKI